MRFIFSLLLIYFARLCSQVPRSHTKVPDLTSDDTQYRVCCLSDSDPLFASDRYSPCRVTVMPACCALANPLTCRLPLACCALRSRAACLSVFTSRMPRARLRSPLAPCRPAVLVLSSSLPLPVALSAHMPLARCALRSHAMPLARALRSRARARCALRSHAMPLARCALRSRAACPSAVSDLTARTHLGAHLSLRISSPYQAVRLWRLPRPPDCAASLHGAYHSPSQNPSSFVCDRGTFWPVTWKQ